jgi:hypothetical protein
VRLKDREGGGMGHGIVLTLLMMIMMMRMMMMRMMMDDDADKLLTQHLLRAVELDPTCATCHLDMGQLHVQMGEPPHQS